MAEEQPSSDEPLVQVLDDDIVNEHDPVPIQPIEPVDPAVPIDDEEVDTKKNFVVTLKYPATEAEVRAGCSATFLDGTDLTLPITQLGGDFQFRAKSVSGTNNLQFAIRVKPTSGILSTALMLLVEVPVAGTNKVQIGLAYGQVL